jgi:hypothetical protein
MNAPASFQRAPLVVPTEAEIRRAKVREHYQIDWFRFVALLTGFIGNLAFWALVASWLWRLPG